MCGEIHEISDFGFGNWCGRTWGMRVRFLHIWQLQFGLGSELTVFSTCFMKGLVVGSQLALSCLLEVACGFDPGRSRCALGVARLDGGLCGWCRFWNGVFF